MRLLEYKGGDIRLARFQQDELPDYAILSHTWGRDHEEFCIRQAETDNLQYFWIDTCCINKDSSAELQESLNYMFRWYKDSKKCYVYLSDVSIDNKHAVTEPGAVSWESAFRACKWFTRGWTLQELIAPSSVTFFSKEGQALGDRNKLESLIRDITGIPAEALQGSRPLQQFSVQDRFSWMKNRRTKLPEDEAYALQGLFNVFTPCMYGSGKIQAVKTLKRLIEEDMIAKLSVIDADEFLQNQHYSDGRLGIERLSGKRLPMEHCYINLAIISMERKIGPELMDAELNAEPKAELNTEQQPKLSPFELFHRLKVSELESNVKLDLNRLFDAHEDSNGHMKTIRRILIRGRPGVGKTTLCKRISFGFKRHEFWNNLFDRILWIPLRYLKTLTSIQCTFKEFLFHHYFRHHDYGRVLAKHLDDAIRLDEDQGQNGKTLLILDGLDEVSQAWNPEDEKHELLVKLLNHPNVIITSRPHAQIPQHVERSIDLELETIGFYPNQVNDYLKMAFQDREKMIEAQAALDKFPLIQGLVRIPILLDAFCYTWDTQSINDDHKIIQTMTDFYQTLVQELLKKDVVRLELFRDGQQVTETIAASMLPTQLNQAAREQLLLLEYLAFAGMFQDMIEFGPLVRDIVLRTYGQHESTLLLDQSLRHISFLRTSDSHQIGENVNYHFLHLTFQEFFAAKYFVRQWTSGGQILCLDLKNSTSQFIERSDFLAKYKYEPRYDIFWRFVAGLLNRNDPNKLIEIDQFFQMLQDPQSRDFLGPAHQRLIMHCLGEVSPQMSLRPELEMSLEQWLIFEIEFTNHSMLAREMEFPDQILCKVLESREYSRDIALLKALRNRVILSDRMLSLIISRIDDSEFLNTEAAVKILVSRASDPRVLQALLVQLKDGPHSTRKAIVKVLGSQVSDPRVRRAIMLRLDDDNHLVAEAAAKALSSQVSDPQVKQALLAQLNGSSFSLRWAVAEALSSHMSDLEVRQGLLDLFNNRSYFLRPPVVDDSDIKAAVKALRSQLSDPGVKQTLLYQFDNGSNSIMSVAAEALSSQASDSQMKQSLIARLNSTSGYKREAAVKALSSQLHDRKVVQALLAQLNDQYHSVRGAIAEALSSQASDLEVKQALLGRLNDNICSVRKAAVKALSSQMSDPQVKQALLVQLDDTTYSVREAAIEALSIQVSDSQVKQAFLEQLDNGYYSLRGAVFKALGSQVSDPRVMQTLLAQLNDNNYPVRYAAVKVLSNQLLNPQIKQALLEQLNNNYYSLGRAIAKALGSQVSDLRVMQTLLAQLDNNNYPIRHAAVEALSNQLLNPQVKQALLEQLNNSYYSLRGAIAKALGNQVSDPRVMQALLVQLDDNTHPVRHAAVEALSNQLLNPQVKQALLEQLNNGYYSLRGAVAKALGNQVSDPRVMQALLVQLDDNTHPIRHAAVKALSNQLSNPQVKQALLEQLENTDDKIRWTIIKAFSSQASDPKVKQALITQLNGHSSYIRVAAAEALTSELSDPKVKQAVMVLLEDTDTITNIRWTAANILLLYQTDGFNLFNKREIKKVYSCLFEQCFQTHYSWQVQSNISRLILPEGSRELCITGVSQFSRAVKEAQESHHTPDVSTKKERRFLKGMVWPF